MKEMKNFMGGGYAAPSIEVLSCEVENGFQATGSWEAFLTEDVEWGSAGNQFE